MAKLRLQAEDSHAIDWYDHSSLVAGSRDPVESFIKDRTTAGENNKVLPYTHRRQCTVAASAWKSAYVNVFLVLAVLTTLSLLNKHFILFIGFSEN